MKFTFNEIFEIYVTLSNLKSNSFKVNYWIHRNKKIFEDSYNFFISERMKVFDKYLNKDKNGQYFTISDNIVKFNLKENTEEYGTEFSTVLNSLFETDCELDPYTISASVLIDENLEITLDQINAIDKLFTDD